MIFKQIQQHGDNFSYIIGDPTTQEAAVVDSSFNSGEILRTLKTENLTLKYVINTHGHSDHTAGNAELLAVFNAKIVVHESSGIDADIRVDEGDTITVGDLPISIIHTPGHTPGSICLLTESFLLAGDTIFPGGPGKTGTPDDFRLIIQSLEQKIFVLPDDVKIYPGHGEPTTVKKAKEEFAVFSAKSHDPDLCGDVLWLKD